MRLIDMYGQDQGWLRIDSNSLVESWGVETKPSLITEATYKEVAQMIDPNFLKQKVRVAELRKAQYDKFDPYDTMHFSVPSSEYAKNGIIYDTQIKFDMMDEIMEHKDLSTIDRARLLLWYSDIHVRCNCPSFHYHYAYVATQKGIILPPEENRPAEITNPRNRGVTCKHLTLTLKVLPFNSAKIATHMKKMDKEA